MIVPDAQCTVHSAHTLLLLLGIYAQCAKPNQDQLLAAVVGMFRE